MIIDERFEIDENISPIKFSNAKLYAGSDRRKPKDDMHKLCTIKVYDSSVISNPYVRRYVESAWRSETLSLRRLSRWSGHKGAIIKYLCGGIGDIHYSDGSTSENLYVVWESARESEDDHLIMRSFREGLQDIRKKLKKRRKEYQFQSIFLKNIFQLLSGVSKMHQKGIVHRNIAPETLIWKKDGEGFHSPKVKLGHFDMSYIINHETRKAFSKKDESYRSFEDVDIYKAPSYYRFEKAECYQDIFSVGIIMYEYLIDPQLSKPGEWVKQTSYGKLRPTWIGTQNPIRPCRYRPEEHSKFIDACISQVKRAAKDSKIDEDLASIIKDMFRSDVNISSLSCKLADYLLRETSHGKKRGKDFKGYQVKLPRRVANTYFDLWARSLMDDGKIERGKGYRVCAMEYLNEKCLSQTAEVKIKFAKSKYSREDDIFLIKATEPDDSFPIVMECKLDDDLWDDDACVCIVCTKFHYGLEIAKPWGRLSLSWRSLNLEGLISAYFHHDIPSDLSSWGDWLEIAENLHSWAESDYLPHPGSVVEATAKEISQAQARVVYSEGYSFSKWKHRKNFKLKDNANPIENALIVYYDSSNDNIRKETKFDNIDISKRDFIRYFQNMLVEMRDPNGRNIALLKDDPDLPNIGEFEPVGVLQGVIKNSEPPSIVLDMHSDMDIDKIPCSGVIYKQLNDRQFHSIKVQRKATDRLRETNNSYLYDQLDHPVSQRVSNIKNFDNVLDIDEYKRELVEKIVNTEPFYIVQGPPGTGKTWMILSILEIILKNDPFARILSFLSEP